MASINAQKKQWAFTIFEPYDYDGVLERLRATCSYAIVGKEECPSTGRKHLQGYACFSVRRRFNGVRDVLSCPAHIEPARGKPDQNYDYCSKGGDFTVIGVFPRGTRPDLEVVCDMLRRGTCLSTIVEDYTSTFVRYSRGIQKALEILGEKTRREWKTRTVVRIGPTGVGKSKWCAEQCGSSPPYYKPRGEWWDGYFAHENVIIDDFYGWIRLDEMLRITDRYPHRVPVKGGFRQFLAKTIYITSNLPISDWYKTCPPQLLEALERRIDDKEEILLQV
uniref:Replication-associated protein n=1 Tax=Circoviridae sp. TaxID=1954248 RepID=A0A6M3YNZ7_9VIRU|nr:MAG: replication associated protein [Circoviridae sp.]